LFRAFADPRVLGLFSCLISQLAPSPPAEFFFWSAFPCSLFAPPTALFLACEELLFSQRFAFPIPDGPYWELGAFFKFFPPLNASRLRYVPVGSFSPRLLACLRKPFPFPFTDCLQHFLPRPVPMLYVVARNLACSASVTRFSSGRL